MSFWPWQDSESETPSAANILKQQKTALREAIASGQVKSVQIALQSLKRANVDLEETFYSDPSLLQTLGSRLVRSHLVAVGTLLDTIAEFEPRVLLAPNKNGKTLADEIAAFAQHYQMPANKRAGLTIQLSERGIELPEIVPSAGRTV